MSTISPVNPFIIARFYSGLSLSELGIELKLSKQYISRIESGNDPEVNERLVDWACDQLKLPESAVLNGYRIFQKDKRASTIEDLNLRMLVNRTVGGPTHGTVRQHGFITFGLWRRVYWESVHAFARDMCVRVETVKPYEDGKRTEMPSNLRTALEESGLLAMDWTDAP